MRKAFPASNDPTANGLNAAARLDSHAFGQSVRRGHGIALSPPDA